MKLGGKWKDTWWMYCPDVSLGWSYCFCLKSLPALHALTRCMYWCFEKYFHRYNSCCTPDFTLTECLCTHIRTDSNKCSLFRHFPSHFSGSHDCLSAARLKMEEHKLHYIYIRGEFTDPSSFNEGKNAFTTLCVHKSTLCTQPILGPPFTLPFPPFFTYSFKRKTNIL